MIEADLIISWQNIDPLQDSPISDHTPTSAQVRDNANICDDNSLYYPVRAAPGGRREVQLVIKYLITAALSGAGGSG